MLINRPSSPARFIVLVVMLVLLGCSEPEGVATKAAASIVFHTGKVYTVDDSRPLGYCNSYKTRENNL